MNPECAKRQMNATTIYSQFFKLKINKSNSDNGLTRGYLRDGFLLGVLLLRPSSVEDFEEVGSLGPHSRVNISLTAFNVIMKIVPEHVYHIDRIVACPPVCMPREQH